MRIIFLVLLLSFFAAHANNKGAQLPADKGAIKSYFDGEATPLSLDSVSVILSGSPAKLTTSDTIYWGDTFRLHLQPAVDGADTVILGDSLCAIVDSSDSTIDAIVDSGIAAGFVYFYACTDTECDTCTDPDSVYLYGGERPAAPSIGTQPVGVYARNGTADSMFGEWSGNDGLVSIQWQVSYSGGSGMHDSTGLTDSVLTLTMSTQIEDAYFRFIITDANGSDTSDSALVDLWSIFTLTASAGTGGSATGSGDYDSSIATPVTAPADPGYVFAYWTTESGTVVWGDSTSASTTVAISENSEVQANFYPYPVIDSIRNWRTLTPFAKHYVIIGDTITIYGTDLGDSTSSTELWLNSTGTEVIDDEDFIMIDGANDSAVAIIPVGTVRGGRKSRWVNGETSLTSTTPDTCLIQVLTPGSN